MSTEYKFYTTFAAAATAICVSFDLWGWALFTGLMWATVLGDGLIRAYHKPEDL